MAMLTVMQEDGNYTKITSAINHLSTAGNMLLDHIEKHGCKDCPSYGKCLNDNFR